MTSLLHTLPLLLFSYILVWIGFSVFRQNRSATVNRLFLAVALTIALYSLIDYLLRTAPNAEQAHLWHRLEFFRPVMLTLAIHFILHFSKRWERYDRPVALLILYGPALFFSVVNLFSDTLRGTPAESDAGWVSQTPGPGIMKYGYLTWAVLIVLFAVCVLWCYCFESTVRHRKRKRLFAYLFTAMVLCALSVVIVRWVFIPALPDIAGSAMSLACIILGGLVWKLELLLTPADIAEEILAIMPSSLILIDPGNTIIRTNRSTLKLCGYREEELTGQNLGMLFNEEVLAKIGFPEAEPRTHIPQVPGEIQTAVKTKHGETKPVLIIATRMYSKNREPIGTVLVAMDLTYIKKAEEQLIKAERLESLETVAGGIAHDFNNLLTTICANLSIVRLAESPAEK